MEVAWNQSYEVFVHSSSTKSCISLILLCVGLCPSSKWLEIWEGGRIIVVGIPQWVRSYWRTGCKTSENALPHISWSINSNIFAMWLDSIYNIRQKLTVTCRIMTWPWTPRAWVSLHINPNCSIKASFNMGNHLVDLCICAFSSAWEHIDVCWKASCFSIF